MMVGNMSNTDPTSIIESLDVATIRERLDRLAEEERALRVFLRAAIARDRYRQPLLTNPGPGSRKAAPDA
jgi:hypothetical protein